LWTGSNMPGYTARFGTGPPGTARLTGYDDGES